MLDSIRTNLRDIAMIAAALAPFVVLAAMLVRR
jgi:hypothetical protein